ncbi:teicoplanin resistance protein VanZ [Actinorhabdospora filicis]|uniref:Teicoplanin resistance protein VanZ n=1 Tax=Actinorhabdospora filicis TaxID=1785913 RepID=A0A9W6SR19_9ACTN|nr:VanZ family protein [Actinorhabdospora filicis]GLZ80622.1 teicoplanin resistance protein VanZ [Actinorhabdospora filicis]
MFDHYLLPVRTAVLLFPTVALAIVIPAAVIAYRGRGRAGGWTTVVFYTFVFYLLAAFMQTVIPLPADPQEVCRTSTYAAHPQLRPFYFLDDIAAQGTAALWPTLLNVALLFPLGVYLRYLWKRGLAATTLIALGTSLFFETTQLTGLWFVYPCPYRQFNVDDLMCNTAGAVLGWLIAGPVIRILPRIDRQGERARWAGRVTFTRRALAYVTDLIGWAIAVTLTLGVLVLVHVAVPDGLLVAVGAGVGLLWFWIVPALTGATVGKHLVLLTLVGTGGRRAGAGALLLRYAILLSPLWLTWLGFLGGGGETLQWLLLAAVIVAWVWSPLAALVRKDHLAPYERLTATRNEARITSAGPLP